VRRYVGVFALVALIIVGGFALAGNVFAFQATPVVTGGTPEAGGTPDTGGPVTAATPPGPAATPSGLTVLRFVEHSETDQVIDLGDSGDSFGDLNVFANPVFDESDTTQVGVNSGTCTRIVVNRWECSWTLILDNGQLTVQGPLNDDADSVLAVVGGTGDFLGASGQLTMAQRPDDPTRTDMTFELL
jgi:allene oxide cyclase